MKKKLAIKGHPTRGKEIIELLEMLGGKREKNFGGNELCCWYYINENGDIDYKHYSLFKDTKVFTLEEFLEKFPYKVGDKVKVPYEDGRITGNELYEYKILKIKWDYLESTIKYGLLTGIEQCIEYYSTDNLNIWNKKETMEEEEENFGECIEKTIQDCLFSKEEIMEEIKIDIPKGYEFSGVDDDKHQVVFAKIQSNQYPKTYEECCEVLSIPSYYKLKYSTYEHGYHEYTTLKNLCLLQDKLNTLSKLLICRNAYWKIAGEQMGLGIPWKPDFTIDNEERYGIYTTANKIEKDFCGVGDVNIILTFPTEEMRDTFYENFKKLIESCKEFL